MNTYHIYFDGQCLFKNLTESEFNIIYGKIYSSYFGERISYEVITEVSLPINNLSTPIDNIDNLS